MQKFFLRISVPLLLWLFLMPLGQAHAATPVDLYFFYGDGCPHCAKEEIFLSALEKSDPDLIVHRYEVWRDQEGQAILKKLVQASNLKGSAVPMTIVGQQLVYGYLDDATTGAQIGQMIVACRATACPDQVAKIIDQGGNGLTTVAKGPVSQEPSKQPSQSNQLTSTDDLASASSSAETITQQTSVPETVHLPLLGDLKIRNLSLPIFTLVIGLIDGFSPCAMWVLVFLISLLLGVKSVARRWILGSVFIIVSGLVYFLFLAAWLNILLLLGLMIWVRVAVGLLAIAAGVLAVREYWTNPEAACKVTTSPTRRRIMDYLKSVALGEKLFLALAGIILIAFAVNLIELFCSAGFPAVYTQVLSMSHLPGWLYYLYLLEYIFFFMLDDMIVFVIAMLTLRLTGVNAKYSRYSNLVGGILILILGILLILRPDILTLGF